MSVATIRQSASRGHTKLDWLDSKHSFSFDQYYDPQNMHFGPLRVMNEDIVQPGQGFGFHPHKEMEILTYIITGEIEHKDSLGNGSIIRRGEIQRMSAGTGIQHSEYNASQENPVHFLQIWIVPNDKTIQPSYEQVKIDQGKGWRLIASAKKSPHAVQIHQDVEVCLAKAQANENLPLEIAAERLGWLQIVKGKVVLDGLQADQGDGIKLDKAINTNLVVKEDTEILFFDLPSKF